MSAIQYESFKELDSDWVQLMVQAKDLGFTTDEIRNIMALMQVGMVEEISGRYA